MSESASGTPSSLPPDLPRLRVLALYLELQLTAVRRAIGEAERQTETERARPRWWVQWLRDRPGQPRRGVLHREGCWCPGEPALRVEEVRQLLATHRDRIEHCPACRPSAGRGN